MSTTTTTTTSTDQGKRQCIGMSAHEQREQRECLLCETNIECERHIGVAVNRNTHYNVRGAAILTDTRIHTHPLEPIHTTVIMRFNVYRDAVRSLVLYTLLFRLAFFPLDVHIVFKTKTKIIKKGKTDGEFVFFFSSSNERFIFLLFIRCGC